MHSNVHAHRCAFAYMRAACSAHCKLSLCSAYDALRLLQSLPCYVRECFHLSKGWARLKNMMQLAGQQGSDIRACDWTLHQDILSRCGRPSSCPSSCSKICQIIGHSSVCQPEGQAKGARESRLVDLCPIQVAQVSSICISACTTITWPMPARSPAMGLSTDTGAAGGLKTLIATQQPTWLDNLSHDSGCLICCLKL